ncbi:MAG: hypothetical protein Q8P18_27930 [Pseudomonadota bacterium]|nr:hypothetical protein [Pseudomonadota bacterium]
MSSDRTAPLAPAWLRLFAAVACFGAALPGCEPMESRGDIFAPAPRAPVATAPSAAGPSATEPTDPAFTFPSEPPLVLSSEELAVGDLASGMVTAAGVDAATLEGPAPSAVAAPVAALAAPAAPAPVGLPSLVQWPVRLLSTIPQAQPPRAILGLSSGEERVVSPGSILADQGLVVMAVSTGKVTLARIEPAGDHARIDTIELTAQY